MSELSDFRDCVVEMLEEYGTTCSLESVNATYRIDDGGVVDERVASYTAVCTDLLDEGNNYGVLGTDQRTTGIMYLAAKDLGATPTMGDRIVYQTRNFAIMSINPLRIGGGVVAYRLELAEIGAA